MARRYVSDRKPEILAASGKALVGAFVPHTHHPAMGVEVDFGDVTVRLAGEQVTCFRFIGPPPPSLSSREANDSTSVRASFHSSDHAEPSSRPV